MINEILINVSPQETRAALLDNGVLQELIIERNAEESQVGNIYCGKVVRVLAGMQAAFVDIGFERTAFLHIKDINLVALNKPSNTDINTVVRAGQLLNVQVIKDPLGSKGARLTTHYSLSSHYLVYMPQTENIGISQRIVNATERTRLHEMLAGLLEGWAVNGGFIVRTAAEGASKEALQADVSLLSKQWQMVVAKPPQKKAGTLIYKDLPMVQRLLRDAVQDGVERVLIDDQCLTTELIAFAENFVTAAVPCIHYYDRKPPMFDAYAIEGEITKALSRRVNLKCGGHIVFDQTEAMTTVDVNTGSFVGKTSSDETAYNTNLEAAVAIARQLRVRNVGGIIIIDFIDMPNTKYRHQVNLALDNALAKDRAKTSRYALQELGLAALTRQRTRESLAHILCDSCPTCDGQGRVHSVETVINNVFRDIYRQTKEDNKHQLMVVVASEVGEILLGDASERLSNLALELGVTARVRIDAQYARDHFDLILL